MEAVFAIEEQEVHLHPQAARTLWDPTAISLLTVHAAKGLEFDMYGLSD